MLDTAAPATGGPALPIAPKAPQLIPHNVIDVSPLNPRKAFPAEELQGLADSIHAEGVLQNVVLRPHPKTPGRFELVAGERRWRAVGLNIKARRAPADYPMPAIVKPMSDDELMMTALAENMARQDLQPLEEAQWFKRLVNGGVHKAKIAERIGKTVRFVELRLALVDKLAPEAKEALAGGKISLEQARVIAQAPKERQTAIVKEAPKLERAEDLKAAVRKVAVPVDAAFFPLEHYKGELATDDLFDKRQYFADVAQFTRLQKEAIAAKVAKLEEKWPWVDVVEVYPPYGEDKIRTDYLPGYYERRQHAKAGALILVSKSGERICRPAVVEGVVKQDDPKKGGGEVARAAAPRRDSADEKAAKRMQAFAEYCAQLQTFALQRFVMATPAMARHLALLSLLGSSQFLWDEMLPAERIAADVKAAIKALDFKPPSSYADRLRQLHRALDFIPARKREQAFATLIAGCVEVQQVLRGEAVFGRDKDELEVLRAFGFDPLKGWSMTEDFLKACPDDVVKRIWEDVGGVGEVALGPMRNAILKSAKAKTYRPPWLELGTAAELAARLKAKPAAAPAKPTKIKRGVKK